MNLGETTMTQEDKNENLKEKIGEILYNALLRITNGNFGKLND